MTTKFSTAALVVFALAFTATAAMSAVKLPKTAKLLDKAGIVAAYCGKTILWDHPNTDKVKGTVIFNAKMTNAVGTYVSSKNKGEFESKVSFKGDQYCFSVRVKPAKEYAKRVCNLIYLDGTTAYEVNPKSKTIVSVNTIQ